MGRHGRSPEQVMTLSLCQTNEAATRLFQHPMPDDQRYDWSWHFALLAIQAYEAVARLTGNFDKARWLL